LLDRELGEFRALIEQDAVRHDDERLEALPPDRREGNVEPSSVADLQTSELEAQDARGCSWRKARAVVSNARR